MDYPSNSRSSRRTAPRERKIERVTSAEAVRRRKPLGRQLADTFIGGDAKSALSYVVFEVLIPAAKDALADAGSQGIERIIFGESKMKRRSSPGGATGHINYRGISMGVGRPSTPARSISPRGRAIHNFTEIVISDRREAQEVLDSMYDILSKYESVTIADLYDLVGITPTHADHKWGWDDLHGSRVERIKQGYLLDLPEPEPLE